MNERIGNLVQAGPLPGPIVVVSGDDHYPIFGAAAVPEFERSAWRVVRSAPHAPRRFRFGDVF
jgi:hypothetical protein